MEWNTIPGGLHLLRQTLALLTPVLSAWPGRRAATVNSGCKCNPIPKKRSAYSTRGRRRAYDPGSAREGGVEGLTDEERRKLAILI